MDTLSSKHLDLKIVKDADRLTKEEFSKLKLLYIKYYREKYSGFFQSEGIILDTLLKLYSIRLAGRMIDDIRTGKDIISVFFSGEVPIGFITGRIDEESCEEVSIIDYYVSSPHAGIRRNDTIDMFWKFVRIVKKMGIKRITAKSDTRDYRFIDILEMLEFEPKVLSMEMVKYGYKL